MELHFRKMKESDMEMVMRWRTDPEVSQYMYTDFVPSLERQIAWCHRVNADPTKRYWIITVDGESVGVADIINIDNHNRRCEWAYYLASPSVRGKGIGKSVELNLQRYAFENLNIHKFCCEVFVSNQKVIQIHEKYGSVVEGTRREHIFKGGKYHDIVEMAIFKDDWEKNWKDKIEYIRGKFE